MKRPSGAPRVPELRTARLLLRRAKTSDLHDLFAIFHDARAMRYWSTPPHADITVTRDRLDRMIASAPPLTNFVIERDGRAIGTAGNYRDAEVGFILHPDHWRQGLVREAMAVIIPHLWQVTDLPRLTADADPLNAASVGLLTALGFAETHRARNTFCIDGKWSDSVYFALDRPAPDPHLPRE